MNDYPEIQQLKTLRERYQISIEVLDEHLDDRSDFKKVLFFIGQDSFEIFIDDEFQDSSINNIDLHLCLVLRALEAYQEADDFLVWCTHLGLNASTNAVRRYHMDLGSSYREIEKRIGSIDSFISDLDFQLNAGAAQALRNSSVQ